MYVVIDYCKPALVIREYQVEPRDLSGTSTHPSMSVRLCSLISMIIPHLVYIIYIMFKRSTSRTSYTTMRVSSK